MLFLNSFKLILVSLWSRHPPQLSLSQSTYSPSHCNLRDSHLSLSVRASLIMSWGHPSSSLSLQSSFESRILLFLSCAFQIQVKMLMVIVCVDSPGDSWEGIPAGWSPLDSARGHCTVWACLSYCFLLKTRSPRDSDGSEAGYRRMSAEAKKPAAKKRTF